MDGLSIRAYNGGVVHSLKRLWSALARLPGCKVRRVERRRETRLPAHGSARIRWDVKGTEHCEVVSLLGVSARGFSFRTAQPLSPEQKILVEVEEQEFEAVIRHNAPEGQEFIIGAQILSEQPSAAVAALAGEQYQKFYR
jgi:hypothetical protein